MEVNQITTKNVSMKIYCIDICFNYADNLKKLEETGILASRKVRREKISIHTALLKLLMEPYDVSMKLSYFDTF